MWNMIHGLIYRIEAFAQVSRVGFVLVGERQPLTDKNKTDPGNLGKSLDPVYQSVNPCVKPKTWMNITSRSPSEK
ncbi:hypothetical protein T265_04078 [Opisthorchis viverrini]|uniref:Uncharacterized protein n=1 Tax=Opisthorchis viverrini TaxID=6198 RepID=A0A075A143_OPIVI|nr:hypothetical protein T265_04078 [Opisthorchis viverrini]KER29230.1 hypothetical protein T265_04078 [Opisthorchis viverrini]